MFQIMWWIIMLVSWPPPPPTDHPHCLLHRVIFDTLPNHQVTHHVGTTQPSEKFTHTLNNSLTISTIHSHSQQFTHTRNNSLTLSTIQSHSQQFTHTFNNSLTLSTIQSHFQQFTHTLNNSWKSECLATVSWKIIIFCFKIYNKFSRVHILTFKRDIFSCSYYLVQCTGFYRV